MQNVLQNTGDTAALLRRLGLLSRIFRDYRNHFGLFWRVMLPVIIVSLLFIVGLLLFFKFGTSEARWIFNTSDGSSLKASSTLDGLSGTSRFSSQSTGVHWKINLGALTLYPRLGFLWLTMCPLAFVIVQYCSGVNVTSRTSWQRTLRRTVPILGIWMLLWLVGWGIFFGVALLMSVVPGISPLFMLLLFTISVAYFVVKWSLYHQGIIIENLSAIAALRRSSKLVRGAFGRFLSLHLLFAWASVVITTVLLSLTVLLLSFAVPELIPAREALLSVKFFTLFWCNSAEITLDSTPSFWVLAVLGSVTILIHAALAPIWALLTTHLYIERTETEQNSVSC